jgi:hypothetical protein
MSVRSSPWQLIFLLVPRLSVWICLQSVPPVLLSVHTLVRWSICLLRTSICLFLSRRLGSSWKGCLSRIPSEVYSQVSVLPVMKSDVHNVDTTWHVVCCCSLCVFSPCVRSEKTRTCKPIWLMHSAILFVRQKWYKIIIRKTIKYISFIKYLKSHVMPVIECRINLRRSS